MGKLAYLDCSAGIAGDMCLGALVDVGVPLEYLSGKLQNLAMEDEYQLSAHPVHRHAQAATKVEVELLHNSHHHHRHLPQIQQLITRADLPSKVKTWSLNIFEQLAIAEGAVHGIAPEKVHFHEVGATDAIVDVVGTCLGLDWLEIEEVYCSKMPTGGGTVQAAHGILPVPVPAVLKLWERRGVPIYDNGIAKELVTPTGAAIATTLSVSFGIIPPMNLHKIGLGAGTRELAIPNLLRLWIGYQESPQDDLESIVVLETQVDDISPQAVAYTQEMLLQAGARDVFTTPIHMKKSRQGILITVICTPDMVDKCEKILFEETTTIGIRRLPQTRRILPRHESEVTTIYGKVRVKVASWEGKTVNVQPEYEDCARIAREYNQPWRSIHKLVLEQYKHEET